MKFVRVRIVETGAHWDAPESAIGLLPGLEPLDRPESDTPAPSKPKKNLSASAAATEPKE